MKDSQTHGGGFREPCSIFLSQTKTMAVPTESRPILVTGWLARLPSARRFRTAYGTGSMLAATFTAVSGISHPSVLRCPSLYRFRICGSSNAINLIPFGWLHESLCGSPCAISICAKGKKFWPLPAG